MYENDEILGFETDTVWGIGCHPKNKKAVDRIYEIKGRDRTKPLILMSFEIEKLMPYIKNIPHYAEILMEKHFPGALTLIFEKTDICPDYICANFNTVGVRIPHHEGFFDICKNVEGGVLATTSLNISNEPPVENYAMAYKFFGDKINVVKPYDEGKVKGVASTVVLCTGESPKVLRHGSIYI